MAGDLFDPEQPWRVHREEGGELKRGRSSGENQLHSPGGLEVNAPTVKHLPACFVLLLIWLFSLFPH